MKTSKFQIYFNGKKLEEGDFQFWGEVVRNVNSWNRALAKIEWNIFMVSDHLCGLYQPICVVEVEPEIVPFKSTKLTPAEEGEAAARQDAHDLDRDLEDALIPKYAIQVLANPLLVKIAKGELDMKKLARSELASRGRDIDGRWRKK